MSRTLLIGILFLSVCAPAFAQDDDVVRNMLSHVANPSRLVHWIITLLGMIVVARLAWQAFGRAVPVGDLPTFPRYMTSSQQYRLGSCAFVLFACGFFLVLVQEHRQVIALAPFIDILPKNLLQAVQDQSAPYLLIVVAMGAVYLYLLTKEAPWNVLLTMRDVIRSWISIPHLAKHIIAQIRVSLHVPNDAIRDVIAGSTSVVEQDFQKDQNTPDRIWAETSYMKWWVARGQSAGEDAIFFTEESFGLDKLTSDFYPASLAMREWKSGSAADPAAPNLAQTIKDLHNRFSRLVACYLIYRNGSRRELAVEAHKFGIELKTRAPENPLRYWIVYVMALTASVWVGVYASAIFYDLLAGKGLVLAQDPDRAVAWVMYALSNYGLAIAAVLLLRYVAISLGSDLNQSHLVTYCWTLAVAFFVGPLGLTIAVHIFGQGPLASMPPHQLYDKMLIWGLGPALVCVYISYYLDRQTCSDLPDIDHSPATLGWRLVNCFGFAAVMVFLLLPPLLAITAQPGAAWDSDKLRLVATGTTFFVALGLAMAAQFALRKGARAPRIVLSRA